MIKIYGKGDTVSNSEYWDGRTQYNGLSQFLEKKDNTIAIRDIFSDNVELFSFVDSINASQYYIGGVVRYSFNNEFDIKLSDFYSATINNITRKYVRCSPGIAVNNGIANINKPATELAVAELKSILNLKEKDDESIEIKYDLSSDTFKARINKIINEHMETLDFCNGVNFEDDSQAGYNTGIELLHNIYLHPDLTDLMSDAIGDELTKIDLEITEEVTAIGTYYWCLNSNGLIELKTNTSGVFGICNFTIVNLDSGIDNFDNTHVYSGETETVNGDLVVTGDLTVEGTTTTIESETVTIKDNIIQLNSNQTGTPPSSLQSGIEVNRGDLTNYQFIFDEATDTFVIGEIGDLQPVATRETNPNDDGIAVWDDANARFTTSVYNNQGNQGVFSIKYLGHGADSRPSIILFARKYDSAYLNKEGFEGTLFMNRGNNGAYNISVMASVICTTAYSGNVRSLLASGGNGGSALRLIEVDYNSETWYGVYSASISSRSFSATGIFYSEPIFIADASSYTVTYVNSTYESFSNGNEIWHAGNDGSGSGLDADLLDGINSSQFVRSDADDTVNGNIELKKGIGYTGDGLVHILKPGGGSLYLPGNNNGYIKITLPVSWTSTMLSFDISLYNYTGGTNGSVYKMRIGGYNYSDTSTWYNTSALILSTVTDRFYNVRFGHDGTHCAIYIGESNTSWSYLVAAIDNVTLGHTSNFSAWNDNWDITMTTSLGTIKSTSASKLIATYSLNSDKLDGINSSQFLRSDTADTAAGVITFSNKINTKKITTSNGTELVLNAGESEGAVGTQSGEFIYANAEQGLVISTPDSAHDNWASGYTVKTSIIKGYSMTIDGHTVWHSGNDGSGSGLDADKLDGLHASQFARKTSLTINPSDNAWWTIATSLSGRTSGKFTVLNLDSGRHQTFTFYASINYGSVSTINVINNSSFGTVFTRIRIGRVSTYDGAVLQVYAANTGINNNIVYLEENYASSGWSLKNTSSQSTGEGKTPTHWDYFSLGTQNNENLGTNKTIDAKKWDGAKKTVSTSAPSGGVDGDMWFQY